MPSQADVVKAQNAAAQAAAQARNRQQALDYFNAMDNFYLRQYSDEQNKKLSDQIQKDQFKDALQVSDIRKDAQLRAFDLSEERYREQLRVNQAEFDRAKSDLDSQFDSTLQSYQNQISDQDRAYTQELDQASFNRDRVERNKTRLTNQFGADGKGGTRQRTDALSIERAKDALTRRENIREDDKTRQASLKAADDAEITAQKKEITDVREQTDLIVKRQKDLADLEDARALLSRDSQLANIAFQKQGQRIETLARVGQAKARGRKGKSADRTLQTTLALSGINVARLTNQAFFVQKEYTNTQSAVGFRKDVIGYQDAISKLRETTATTQLTQRQARVDAQDKYATDVRAEDAALDKKEKDTRLVEQQSLADTIALNQFTADTADANAQLDEIAYAIGLSKEQLKMNKERLGASLVSTVETIDNQLLSLEQAKYKADYNAHAARMLPPEFAPDAKAPYDVPLPKYIEPRPGAAPAPAYQAQYVPPPTQSALSQALMIGGVALSAAAIPFTLGASAALAGGATAATSGAAFAGGAFGSMTVGGAAALGAGLGGVGGGLTQFSQMPFIYN